MPLLILGNVDGFSNGLGKRPVLFIFPRIRSLLFNRGAITFRFNRFSVLVHTFIFRSTIETCHRNLFVTFFRRLLLFCITTFATRVIRAAITFICVIGFTHAVALIIPILFFNLLLHFSQLSS